MDTSLANAKRLYDVLLAQTELINQIYQMQKSVRSCVTNRDWDSLQSTLYYINELSEGFTELEERRVSYFKDFGAAIGSDITNVVKNIPPQFKNPIQSVFNDMKKKLLASKIENDAINEYVKLSQEFLQGIFDSVLPQRRNTLYSRTGSLIKNQPDSIVLNAVM